MSTQGDHQYEADIRWTTHGVAHVRAADWGSLGFGQGWACARDHLPTIADQIVKVRGERARFHGAGTEGGHLASDFGYLALGVVRRAEGLRAAQPPWIRALVSGYVAGCNIQLAESKAAGSLPAWCADAPWIRPIDELDFYAYLGDVALMGSGRNLAGIIGRAEAPGPDGPVEPSPVSALGGDPGASNGWAFGGDATASGHGIVMANPHFPWYGEARFWECHLTVPGELDVYGVSLLGTPGVQMGFTEGVAWAHTFSNGHRFTMYRQALVPGAPTRYRYGDGERAMTSATYAIEVATDGGAPTTLERTLWSTHHGPMVNLPLVGWGLETGFSYRDANVDNTAVLRQFLEMDLARDLDEFQQVFADVQGLPWVNTLAADRTGRVWYVDGSATPLISAAAQQRYLDRLDTDLIAQLLLQNRVAMLDGSEPDDEWVDDPGARSPGLVPFRLLPQQERRDHVVNANDSHWLSNVAAPLEGFSPLHGLERRSCSLRTRQNLRTVERLAADHDATVARVVDAVLSNESLSAELIRDEVVARATKAGTTTVDGSEVDVAAAAEVLFAWDGRADLASVGATLWREFMVGFPDTALREAGAIFAVPFDADDPVETPCGLVPPPASGPDPVVDALARAVLALQAAGVAIDAPLGAVQWAARGDVQVPVSGGGEGEGVLNVLAPVGALPSSSLEPTPAQAAPVPGRTERTGLRAGGYQVTYGSSFLMAVEMTYAGPIGVGLLAYGQAGDPASPHHADGTEAFAAKAVRPLLFHDADIEADTEERRTLLG